MKLSKWEGAILVIAALFLGFTAGWFLRGDRFSPPIRVETQRRLTPSDAVVILPAETEEPAQSPAAGGKIDINTADVAALQTLPGIGEKRAEIIVADREENGAFRHVEDITRVKGIGEEILAGIMDYITVGEENP